MAWSDLISDIDGFLARTDMSSVAPTLIQLAEDRHAKEIRVRAMETRTTIAGDGTRFVDLPADYLEARRVRFVNSDGNTKFLDYIPPAGFEIDSTTDNGGRPVRYTIVDKIELDHPLATNESVGLAYYARFTRLDSVTNTTNWLLENAYGTYLYGALAESTGYLAASERQKEWEALYIRHRDAIMNLDRRARVPRSPQIRQRYPERLA